MVIFNRDSIDQKTTLPHLLLVANFLSHAGGSRAMMEDLAERLQHKSSLLICTSTYFNRWLRGADMLFTTTVYRSRYKLAIVDLFSGPAFIWGEAVSILLSRLHCPFIFVLRGGALPDFATCWPKRVKNCLNRATVVTTPSRYLLERMRPYRPDLHLLPNPLNLIAYQFRLRHTPSPTIIWLRAFHQLYNPALAPKAISLLVEQFPNIQLTMVGPDKKDGSLQQMQQTAKQLSVDGRVILPGGVPKADVPEWLNKGDIFINTTNIDNTPVSVLEAMACGLCVISTNVGGIPYLLTDGEDSLLVPPDDPEAMAAAIRRILTEPGLAEHLSRNARHKAEQFDWSVILPQWESLLLEVSNGVN